MLDLTTSESDAQLIIKIVVRAASLMSLESFGNDRLTTAMDISACHIGCPLDLAGLLAADRFNFVHDVAGIIRHINRETGKLEHFCPRFARTGMYRG